MWHFFRQIKEENQLLKENNHPFLKGIFWGLFLLTLVIMGMAGYFFRTGLSPLLQATVYVVIGAIAFPIFRWLGTVVHHMVKAIPSTLASLVLALIGITILAGYMRFSWPGSIYNITLIYAALSFSLVFGSLYAMVKAKQGKVLYIVPLLVGLALAYFPLQKVVDSGYDPYPVSFNDVIPNQLADLSLTDPSQNGNYQVEYFTYGSGTDERRPEFGPDVNYKTETVNGLPLLPEWKGKRKKWRERYWGFGIDEAPINGRVWMPEGDGPFPLILVVHGNHGMEHHSDPGYAYLGQHLASRGYITVSVDENFINGTWSGDFRGREMPIRAWLLLKHLQQWRSWNNGTGELAGKADMDNVILMGHSRGGEAVSIAAAYNKLSHFPDDATVEFDFNFGIKGLVAIAPTDIRYFRRIELEDINYLSLQGTYDADEASFFGLRQAKRVSFSDSTNYFSAGVWIHKGNHGQFNSIWGSRDFGVPYGWFLNTGALIDGEEQRQAAKVFIGAFADRVLKQDSTYEEIFKRPALAKSWLPETVYLSNYMKAGDDILVDYEEDIDVTTGTKGQSISSNELLVWREENLSMRGGDSQGTDAVIIGWNSDSVATTPYYEIQFEDSVLFRPTDELLFTLGRAKDETIEVADTTNINFSINLNLGDSIPTSVALNDYKKLAPALKIKYMKLDQLNDSFGNEWELNMETVAIPMHGIISEERFLKSIKLTFDKSTKGVVALDDIGVRRSSNY